MHRLTRRW